MLLMLFYCKMQSMKQQMLNIETNGRGTYDISREIQSVIEQSGIGSGLCHLFLQHTSASLILCENADSTVRVDLENFMAKVAPDGDPVYQHDMEGPDDMPAHIRTILTQNSLTIPIVNGRGALGTWQGVFLWEHRTRDHIRKLVITLNK